MRSRTPWIRRRATTWSASPPRHRARRTPMSWRGLSEGLVRHGGWNKWWATRGAIIATRGCPHRCDYCTIPVLYPEAQRMRLRPVEEVAAEIAQIPDRGIVFWDDNIGAFPRYAKELFRA